MSWAANLLPLLTGDQTNDLNNSNGVRFGAYLLRCVQDTLILSYQKKFKCSQTTNDGPHAHVIVIEPSSDIEPNCLIILHESGCDRET